MYREIKSRCTYIQYKSLIDSQNTQREPDMRMCLKRLCVIASSDRIDKNPTCDMLLRTGVKMTWLCLILNLLVINVGSASSCFDAKFTENPQDTVPVFQWGRNSLERRTEFYSHWNLNHSPMEEDGAETRILTFFVDGKERMFFLGKYYEDMQINTVGSLMLKVEVLYRLRSFSELSCIEATANISTTTTIVTTTTNTTTTSIAPINNTSQSDNVIPLVVGAFAGGNV